MKKLLLSLLFLTSSVYAAPVTFDFVFVDPDTSAETTGFIILETDLLNNPGNNSISLPNPAVIDLQLTVTGSAFSDGDYDINDYYLVFFDTNGATLDFNLPLVGQATDGAPWGTTFDGESGEFNLVAFGPGPGPGNTEDYYNNLTPAGIIGSAPTGCWYFTLCEDYGQGDFNLSGSTQGGPIPAVMELQSFFPTGGPQPAVSVPTLSFWALALMVFGLFTMVVLRRKQQA